METISERLKRWRDRKKPAPETGRDEANPGEGI